MHASETKKKPADIGQLLAAARENARLLTAPDDSSCLGDCSSEAAAEWPCPTISDYQLVREVHRGGQGVVYQAICERSGDDVAIKILHDRSRGVSRELERFEREAAALRELDHPNLIAVSAVGEVDGRPFLVMPYIPGWPLDEFVRRNALSVRETLTLFAKVCEAVNVAHLNGVIHRDLKPGNVRVDDSGEPHVLDFGLAKPAARGVGRTLTETGQFVGSLPWASPEQADPSLGRVDVRTDVYSLGAVMYHLLTGALPIDPTGSQRDVLNRIVTVEPPRPRSIRREISSDVETIVLKCLSKDRARRYASAGALHGDLRRCLEGRAIEAKRDTTWYVFRKLVRHHWLSAGLSGLTLIAITVAMVTVTVLWQSSERQRHRAESAVTLGRDAQARLAKLLDHLGTTLSKSAAVEPVRQMLERYVAEYEAAPPADPSADCLIRLRVAGLYSRLRDFAAAGNHTDLALQAARLVKPPDEELLADALSEQARYRAEVGDFAAAMSLLDEAGVLLARRHGAHSAEYIWNAHVRAWCLMRTGDKESGEQAVRAVLDQADRYQSETLGGLAKELAQWLCDDAQRYDEAIVLHRRAVQWARRHCGRAELAHFLNSYGHALRLAGEMVEAEQVLRECVQIRSQTYAPEDTEAYYLYVSQSQLGAVLCDRGQYSEAESLLLAAHRGLSGPVAPMWESQNPKYLRETTERLAKLYADWCSADPEGNHESEAAYWQQVLAEMSSDP